MANRATDGETEGEKGPSLIIRARTETQIRTKVGARGFCAARVPSDSFFPPAS